MRIRRLTTPTEAANFTSHRLRSSFLRSLSRLWSPAFARFSTGLKDSLIAS